MPSGLVGTIYTQSKSGFMENPYFEKLADFSYVMWMCGGLAPWSAPCPKCAFGDQNGLIRKKVMPFGNPSYHGTKIADFQRLKTTSMDHRNKIQSLVLLTDDPGDALDCITEYGPVPVNMAIYAINQPFFSK